MHARQKALSLLKIEPYIPNALTFGNLFCGFAGLLNVAYGDLALAGWLLLAAAGFDLIDGLAARLLRVESPKGQQLDSLSDLVSFGVLPGLILVILVFKTNSNWATAFYFLNSPWLGLLAFLMPMAAAYRLARFNLSGAEEKGFRGLPAPAAGILIGTLPLIIEYDLLVIGYRSIYLSTYILNPWALLGVMTIIPLLMVSNLAFFNLKFEHYGWQGNQVKWAFLGVSAILVTLLFFAAVPLLIGLYIVVSMTMKNTAT